MIKHDANINALSKDNLTPILIAIENSNFEMIELLLSNENLDLASLTKTDESIYHLLPHLLSTHQGKKVILQITHIIR